MEMRLSDRGLDIIKRFEGFSAKPYLCPANVPTIGYGATYYPDGKRVSMKDDEITESYADFILRRMVVKYEDAVNRYVNNELSQNQFDALVSFTYNVGMNAFKNSTLLQMVNDNPHNFDIMYQFSRWNKANGRIVKGLSKRREEETILYFS